MTEHTLIAPVDVTIGPDVYHIVAPPVVPVKPLPSPAWTEMPPAASIVMDDGCVVAVLGGSLMLDGAPMGSTSFVDLVVKDAAGRIWHRSTAPGLPRDSWWGWTGASWSWTGGPDPRPVTPPVVTPPVVTPPVTTSPKDRALAFFAGIRGKSWVLAQQVHDSMFERDMDVSAGLHPAMLTADLYMDFQPYSSASIPALRAHAAANGLVAVSAIGLPNPVSGGNALDQSGVSAVQITTPGTAQYAAFVALADRVAAGLKPLDDLGIPVFHRALHEADMAGGFWWSIGGTPGSGMFTTAQYVALYGIYAARLRAALKHVIMCWSTNGNRVDHYPPTCDIVGFDAYTSAPAGYGAHYDALVAKAPGKPIWMCEFGSGSWQHGDRAFDCQTLIDAIRSRMPAISLVNAWSDDPGHTGWAWGSYANTSVLTRAPVLGLGQTPLG